MKLKSLKIKNHTRAIRILLILFPFLGLWTMRKLFQIFLKYGKFYEVKKQRRFLGLVAFSTLFFLKRKFLYLQYLVINPEEQSKGIGSKILKRLELKAKSGKYSFIVLMSAPWRTNAHNFYAKNQYKKIMGFLFWKKI